MARSPLYMEGTSSEDTYFKEGCKMQINRTLVFFTVVVLVLLATLVVLATLLAIKLGDTKEDDACTSEHCINTASRLLRSMNTRVDPCDNFYEYACGQWVQTHRVPEAKGSIDQMEKTSDKLEADLQDLLAADERTDIEPVKKAKSFYDSCLNEELIKSRGTEDMLQFIEKVGGWPVLGKGWDETAFDLEKSIALTRHYFRNYVWPIPSGIIIGMNILNDYKVYGKHVIYFDQPSLLMDGRRMYLDETAPVFDAYRKYALDVAIALGADSTVASEDMNATVAFETEIAKSFESVYMTFTDPRKVLFTSAFGVGEHHFPQICISVPDRRDMEENYKRMNITKLTDIYPTFDWLRYLQEVYRGSGITIDSDEEVILWMKPYFDQLFSLLHKTPKRTIANYITWRLMQVQMVAMDERFRMKQLEFRKATRGIKQLKPRSQQCTETTNLFMDQATGRIYSEKQFGQREKVHMLELIAYLRRVFKDIVNDAEWMDDSTKESALKKLETMKSLIGFPSAIFNNTYLTEYYESFHPLNDTFFDNLNRIRKYIALKQLLELRQPSFERWPARPAIVNAFYHNGLNAIVFPAGILQSPYYDINYPASVNFGGIGLVIGHEITHGYDASGRSFDEKGLLNNWWSDFSLNNFKNKSRCIIEHYSKFIVPNIQMNINGNNTLSENIADIGGIKSSFMAYKLWLKEHADKDVRLPGIKATNEQLFFINTAQLWCSRFTDEEAKRSVLTGVHSLPMFRVIGELQNSVVFSKAFNCRKGSYMNPSLAKCSVW